MAEQITQLPVYYQLIKEEEKEEEDDIKCDYCNVIIDMIIESGLEGFEQEIRINLALIHKFKSKVKKDDPCWVQTIIWKHYTKEVNNDIEYPRCRCCDQLEDANKMQNLIRHMVFKHPLLIINAIAISANLIAAPIITVKPLMRILRYQEDPARYDNPHPFTSAGA